MGCILVPSCACRCPRLSQVLGLLPQGAGATTAQRPPPASTPPGLDAGLQGGAFWRSHTRMVAAHAHGRPRPQVWPAHAPPHAQGAAVRPGSGARRKLQLQAHGSPAGGKRLVPPFVGSEGGGAGEGSGLWGKRQQNHQQQQQQEEERVLMGAGSMQVPRSTQRQQSPPSPGVAWAAGSAAQPARSAWHGGEEAGSSTSSDAALDARLLRCVLQPCSGVLQPWGCGTELGEHPRPLAASLMIVHPSSAHYACKARPAGQRWSSSGSAWSRPLLPCARVLAGAHTLCRSLTRTSSATWQRAAASPRPCEC